jgi:hypothetical protein
MIPLPVVGHRALDRKRFRVPVADDHIERLPGHSGSPSRNIGRQAGDSFPSESPRAGDKPRATRPVRRRHHHGIGIFVRNNDIVRTSATMILAARIVRRAPFVEAIRATICQRNIHNVFLSLPQLYKCGDDLAFFHMNFGGPFGSCKGLVKGLSDSIIVNISM